MSDEKKKYETEWSFSFANIGESISQTLASLGIGEDAEIKTAHFAEALENATGARVVLEPTVGQASVSAAVAPENLIEADVTYIGEMHFEVKAEGSRKIVLLRQQAKPDTLKPIKDALGSFARRDELQWAMRLSPRIPLDLQINSGMTANEFDLSELKLTALQINGGAGRTELKLPVTGAHYAATLNSGTGELKVTVADDADIDLTVNNGTGKTDLTIGAGAQINARITGGIGACVVTIPAGAGVRLKATTGLGRIHVPDSFVKVKVDEFVATVGSWETPHYAEAAQKIDIKYDGGVGGFTIKFA
jgi:hypothetical protein